MRVLVQCRGVLQFLDLDHTCEFSVSFVLLIIISVGGGGGRGGGRDHRASAIDRVTTSLGNMMEL